MKRLFKKYKGVLFMITTLLTFSVTFPMLSSCGEADAPSGGGENAGGQGGQGGAIEETSGLLTPYDELPGGFPGDLSSGSTSGNASGGAVDNSTEYFNGATLTLEKTADTEGHLTKQLETMKNDYKINTVSIYDLAAFDDAGSNKNKDHLFKELARLNMKAVVRIEAYDTTVFAFRDEDLSDVMQRHADIIAYVSQEERKESIAYFALNMPVDDEGVQKRLGGVNSAASKKNQVTYAKAFVEKMRQAAKAEGFDDAKMYLSIFYGWDNTYQTPEYKSAEKSGRADGYFINNYSYLKDDIVRTADDSDDDLINTARLKISMDSFKKQYGEQPLVIESGFHTLEYNGGKKPNQTAGLVSDVAAKGKALAATKNFYDSNYTFVCGWMYFGYNIFKEEGDPAAVMDWALSYPSMGEMSAAGRVLSGGGKVVEDSAADASGGSSGGKVVSLETKDASVRFDECPAVQQIKITYKSEEGSDIGLYSEGKLRKSVNLKKTESYEGQGICVTIIEDRDLEIRFEKGGPLFIDKVEVCEKLEAENAGLSGMAKAKMDKSASMGEAVQGAIGSKNALTFEGVRGGDEMEISYKAFAPVTLAIVVGKAKEEQPQEQPQEQGQEQPQGKSVQAKKWTLALPESDEYEAKPVKAEIPAGADLMIYSEVGAVELDGFKLLGVPASPDRWTQHRRTLHRRNQQEQRLLPQAAMTTM